MDTNETDHSSEKSKKRKLDSGSDRENEEVKKRRKDDKEKKEKKDKHHKKDKHRDKKIKKEKKERHRDKKDKKKKLKITNEDLTQFKNQLDEAIDNEDAEVIKRTKGILLALLACDMSLASLQAVPIGRTVNTLRRSKDTEVSSYSKMLKKKWVKLLPNTTNADSESKKDENEDKNKVDNHQSTANGESKQSATQLLQEDKQPTDVSQQNLEHKFV